MAIPCITQKPLFLEDGAEIDDRQPNQLEVILLAPLVIGLCDLRHYCRVAPGNFAQIIGKYRNTLKHNAARYPPPLAHQ